MPSEPQNPDPRQAPPVSGQWTQAPVPGQMYYTNYARPQGQPLPPTAQFPIEQPFDDGSVQFPTMYATNTAPASEPAPQQPEAFDDDGQDDETPQQEGVAYQVPGTGFTPGTQPRKNHAVLYIGAALLAVVVLFIVLRLASPGKVAYAAVRSGQMESTKQGDALIVRDETVYAQEGISQISFVAEEGETVDRATQVALVYSSGFSAKEWTKLRNFRTQLKEYHKTLINEASGDARMVALTTKVKERALEARQLVHGVRGSLNMQETLLANAMQDLQIYIKQTYPDDQKLTRLYEDENSQLQRISSWTKQYASATQGIVSFYTDGYEASLNMDTYQNYSPAEVRSMYRGGIPSADTGSSRRSVNIYRIVRPDDWAILVLCDDKNWTPVTGRTYQLQIESFTNTIVETTLESFTLSGGEMLLRLRVNDTDALREVLYMRACRIVMGDSVSSLTVPSSAIYIKDGRKGVVIHTDSGEYWTGVEILSMSDDGVNTFILPENPAVLYEGAQVRLTF